MLRRQNWDVKLIYVWIFSILRMRITSALCQDVGTNSFCNAKFISFHRYMHHSTRNSSLVKGPCLGCVTVWRSTQ